MKSELFEDDFGDSRASIYSSGCAEECFSKRVDSVTVGFGDLYFVGFCEVPFSLSSEELPPEDAVLLELIFWILFVGASNEIGTEFM